MEFRFHKTDRLFARKGRHPLLQVRQFLNDIFGNQIGASADDLAELDECGAQIFQSLSNSLRRTVRIGSWVASKKEAFAPLQVTFEPDSLDQVIKPMAQQHPHDLAAARQVPEELEGRVLERHGGCSRGAPGKTAPL